MEDNYQNFYTGFLSKNEAAILIPMQITNPQNNKTLGLDVIVDTGFPSTLLIPDQIRQALGVNPDKSRLKEEKASSVEGKSMPVIRVQDVELQLSIPLLREEEPLKFYQQTQPIKKFYVLKPDCQDPVPLVGLDFLQSFHFEILLCKLFIPGVKALKSLVNTVEEHEITPWGEKPISPKFLEALNDKEDEPGNA